MKIRANRNSPRKSPNIPSSSLKLPQVFPEPNTRRRLVDSLLARVYNISTMKIIKLLGITALLLGISGFRANADVGLTISITANLLIQSTNSVTNARTQAVTVGPPTRRVLTTAQILQRLAQDENSAGLYPTNRFPRGARLVATNDTFVVMVGTNVLVDVSNVISFDEGTNNIFSGTRDTNGLSHPVVKTHLARIIFDDTGIIPAIGLRFYLQGVMTETTIDSAVDRNGNFTETHIVSMPQAAGEGVVNVGDTDQRQLIATGSVSASGTARGPLLPPL